MVRILIATALVFGLAGAVSAHDTKIDPLLDACLEKHPSNQGMIACTRSALGRADTRLNKLWEQVKVAVRSFNADLSEPEQHNWDWLLEAQRGWLQYRQFQCRFESEQMHGGTGAPLLEAGCMLAKTEERNAELLDLLKLYTDQ